MPSHKSCQIHVLKNVISASNTILNQLKVFQCELNSNTNDENPKPKNIFEFSRLGNSYKSSTSEAFH